MIKQGKANSMLEKKFKILRTSLLLGNVSNREDNLFEYEKTAREVDEIKRDVYEELLAGKMYVTTSLEDEQVRLMNLISFIEKRIKERNDFIDDYIKVTSNFLDDLPKVSLENELPNYKLRLDNINEYMNNCREIESLVSQLKNYRDELEKKYENKANNEVINLKLEDELIEEFNKIVSSDKYYSELNYLDIENELDRIDDTLREKKDVMNTFISSYQALENAGINGAEMDEYRSYVQDAKSDYYSELEKKYYLNIYKLVLDKQNDYNDLYQKRTDIENILRERQFARNDLDINTRDNLSYFANLCNEQFSVIKSQKFNIESIEKLILDIADCEDRLERLKEANNRPEIVELLREFETPKFEVEEVVLPKEEEIHNEIVGSEMAKIVPKAGNMVVRVSDPIKINVKNASDTAKLVMKKVVIVLEPKKFNTKRDKLKEAEAELAKEQNKKLEFTQFDVDNKTVDNSDDVFIDTPVINLNTEEVATKEVKKTIEPNEIKLNMPDNEVNVSTEIFIEDTPEKKPELFSETDPFLDDNKFELEDKTHDIDGDSMPEISNIGTVKPTNMVSKIEEVSKDTDNIILPTMGFTNNDNVVPIVPENYIN